MKVARYYTFELEFLKPAKFPNWKGNLLRGALGSQLKRISCKSHGDCHECSKLFECPYGYIFRTRTKGLVLRKIKHYTKPYVVKPPLESKVVYRVGDVMRFSLVLFGDAVRFEDYVVSAVSSMCRFGLGIRNCRGRLKLRRVLVENPFRCERVILFEDGEFYNSRLFVRRRDLNVKVGKVFKVRFLTPFRLLRDGALLTEPSFRDLMSFMLRKYSSICHQYLGSLDVDIGKVLSSAEGVITLYSNLSRRTFVYRGKEEIFLHGEIVYSGKVDSDVRRVLSFCTLSHIGKRASYGHGWFDLT
jgi:hypothetical protein